MKIGKIGLSNTKKGLIPFLIRFFTKSRYSHTFITTFDICGTTSVQEAVKVVQVIPFEKYYEQDPNTSYELYELTEASEEELKTALCKVFKEFSGVKYGVFQLIWFPYRSFMSLFGIDLRKSHNWFTDGVICSELVYWFLFYTNDKYRSILCEINPDTSNPEDIANIIRNNQNLFKLVKKKE